MLKEKFHAFRLVTFWSKAFKLAFASFLLCSPACLHKAVLRNYELQQFQLIDPTDSTSHKKMFAEYIRKSLGMLVFIKANGKAVPHN